MKVDTPKIFAALGFSAQGDLGPFTMYMTRQRKLVIYVKSIVVEAWTPHKTAIIENVRAIMRNWNHLPAETRNDWSQACKTARLRCTGPSLWLWWCVKQDAHSMKTIEHLAGLSLRKSADSLT